jgi:hypothetical protein
MAGRVSPLAIQLALLLGVAGLGLLPPVSGVMLVLPTMTADPGATLRWVTPAGGSLVAPGPYPGAFVITGNRAAILPAALRHGALVIAARVSGCGRPEKDLV